MNNRGERGGVSNNRSCSCGHVGRGGQIDATRGTVNLDGVGRVGDRGHGVGVLDAGVLVHVGVGRLAGLHRAATARAERDTDGDKGEERRRAAGDGAHVAVLVGLVTVPRCCDEFFVEGGGRATTRLARGLRHASTRLHTLVGHTLVELGA